MTDVIVIGGGASGMIAALMLEGYLTRRRLEGAK